ncbi:hypothetical protein EV681_1721 [Advenella incenata]|uniref:Uncharacterized protein n=1 Tax=Advenella incenata TaxID=267800 RepID=A0A4Q7VTK0_9BURK|nr:hypothetical protein EV681_1721 [Advenella incenata]
MTTTLRTTITHADRSASRIAIQAHERQPPAPIITNKKNHPEGWFLCSMKTSLSDAFH